MVRLGQPQNKTMQLKPGRDLEAISQFDLAVHNEIFKPQVCNITSTNILFSQPCPRSTKSSWV